MSDVQHKTKWWTDMETYIPFLYTFIDGCLRNSWKCLSPTKYQLHYNFLAVRRIHWGDWIILLQMCRNTLFSENCAQIHLSVGLSDHLRLSQLCNKYWFILLDITRLLNSELVSTQKLWVYLNNILMPTGQRMSVLGWCIGSCEMSRGRMGDGREKHFFKTQTGRSSQRIRKSRSFLL